MITLSFGITPALALDFTTAALDSRITFARTTGASNPSTYVNGSGVIMAAKGEWLTVIKVGTDEWDVL